MKPYLIAIDLDGTLLKEDKTISEYTKIVLTKLKNEGHIIVISTGRPFRASKSYYHELALTTPIVNFNGAFVHHPIDDTWESQHTAIDLQIVQDILAGLDKYQIKNVIAQVKDHVFSHHHDQELIDGLQGVSALSFGDLSTILTEPPTGMLIHLDENEIEPICHYLNTVHANKLEINSWTGSWSAVEVVSTGINKSIGLQRIADYYNIPIDRTIAFGDASNDVAMIEWAAYGIAMGNAIEQIKAIAHEVTSSNEEDGVAKFLTTFFS